MPIPAGSHYVPGSDRHIVRLPSGETVSRARAESMYAQERGYRSNYERKTAFRTMKQSAKYEQERAAAPVSGREYDEARARLAAEYKREGNDYQAIDKSPNGPLAKYLVAIGRRSETADYRVGDSPKT
jgi:hypothetical protein